MQNADAVVPAAVVAEPVPWQPTQEEMLRRLDVLGASLREAIVQAKALCPKGGELFESHANALHIAQEHLQTGMLWFRRAVENRKGF